MAPAQGGMKSFYAVLGVIALAGLAVIAWLALRPAGDTSIPANVTVTAADTSGFHGYFMGSDSAPVEVTEYADYQCPGCQQFELLQMPIVREQLIGTGRVRWRYRDFPIDQLHSHARVAAHAAACADEQGRYWDMHRLLYQGQSNWAESGKADNYFRDYAKQLGLDLDRYDACMKSGKYAGRIQASKDEGERVGVNSTPTLLIRGRLYPGGLNSDALEHLVDSLAPAAGATP